MFIFSGILYYADDCHDNAYDCHNNSNNADYDLHHFFTFHFIFHYVPPPKIPEVLKWIIWQKANRIAVLATP